jgi:hypothetical protein
MPNPYEYPYDLGMPPSRGERSPLADPVRQPGRRAPSDELDARADDQALRAERLRYEADGPRRLVPDEDMATLLEGGEGLRAVEPDVLVLGRPGDRAPDAVMAPALGTFAVTSRRLVHASPPSTAIRLEDVEDASVALGRLLLILAGGQSLILETRRPRLLRFHISRARADRSAACRAAALAAQPER